MSIHPQQSWNFWRSTKVLFKDKTSCTLHWLFWYYQLDWFFVFCFCSISNSWPRLQQVWNIWVETILSLLYGALKYIKGTAKHLWWTFWRKYRKTSKINPGLIQIREHFLLGLYAGGLIYGTTYGLLSFSHPKERGME